MAAPTVQKADTAGRAQLSFESERALQPPTTVKTTEFDPCAVAKPCSPFYLYNHDSPRPSMDHKYKPSVQVSVHDLELGDSTLSPSVSQEKLDSHKKNSNNKGKVLRLFNRQPSLRTTPKKKGRLASMPKKQRLIVKLVITFLVAGAMVGIAVGIAAGLKSGVWRGQNSQGNIS